MSNNFSSDESTEKARKTWATFTVAAKWTIVVISISVLLLGIIFTDLF